MVTSLVADRFARDSAGAWRDLATGRVVSLQVRRRSTSWDVCAAGLADVLMRPEPGGRTLVDFGPLGSSRCFEAYAAWPALRPTQDPAAVAAAVTRAVACVASPQAVRGPARIDLTCRGADRDHLLVELARALRGQGFVLLRSSVALPASVVSEIRHRHVAVVACGESSGRDLATWIERLARASPRPHLFCRLGTGKPLESGLVVRERSTFEGPEFTSSSLPGSRVAFEVFRWGQGRQRMRILHFVPGLLQVVHDAEDEAVALRAGCSWVRTHAGASAVAVVAGPNRDVIAEQGWSRRQMAVDDLQDLCREVPQSASADDAPGSLGHVGAPVRYAGAVIGHVIGRGVVADLATIGDAVQALAALSGPALRARLDAGRPDQDLGTLMPELVGRSQAMMTVRESIRQAARTSFPVLIEGESGTGKELAARALHRLSARRSRRFMAVNCAALTDDLVEAELFGFARGAFTGAIAARPGLFEEAHGGSLFLDEVGELSARAQAKLLRALQEREVRRVGENAARAVDVRVIAATNRPLAEAVAARAFREDLMFRLAVVRIALPALRDRLEDLPALASAFWRQAMDDVGKQARLTREAVGALCDHGWPGNVRELQNVLAGLAVRAPGRGAIGARQIRLQLAGAAPGERLAGSLGDLRRQCERHAVACALARHGGRRTAAARELGLSRQGLAKAIRRLGIASSSDAAGVA